MKKLLPFLLIFLWCFPSFAYKEVYSHWTSTFDKVGVDNATDISSNVCSDGQILKKVGGVWACASDDSTAGGGTIRVSEDGTFVVSADTLNFTTGVKATATGTKVSVSGDIATTSAPGIASFDTNNFTVGAFGGVAVKASGIGPTELASTAVTPGSYTNTNLTVDSDGRITSASNGSSSGGGTSTIAVSEDGTFVVSADTMNYTTGINASSSAGGKATISADIATHSAPGIVSFDSSDFGIRRFGEVFIKRLSRATGGIGTLTSIDFTVVSANPVYQEGRLFYDSAEKTFDYYNAEADVTMNLGLETWVYVQNMSGATITNGTPVYLVSSNGVLPTVLPTDADSEVSSLVVGIATHDIENNTSGYVTQVGLVRTMNTGSFVSGDKLYISQTTGALTATAPTSPAFRVPAAVVTTVSASQGSVLVRMSGVGNGFGTANQIFGMNSAGTAREYKTVNGVANETDITHGANSLTVGIIDPLVATKGGTGVNSGFLHGYLPIGNGTGFTLAPIVSGSNITVTNTAGGISIASTGGSGYSTVQQSGSSLTQRPTLNFVGSGIGAVDNSSSTRTDVIVKATPAWIGGNFTGTSATRYNAPFGGSIDASNTNVNFIKAPYPCTARNLTFGFQTVAGANRQWRGTIWKGGVSTNLTCVAADPSLTCQNKSVNVSFVSDDTITFEAERGGAATTPGIMVWDIECDGNA